MAKKITSSKVDASIVSFVAACETFGLAQGAARSTADKSDAAFMPILIAHVKDAPKEKGTPLEDFKRDIRAHIIAPYMTGRGFPVTFDMVRPCFDQGDKKAACIAAAVGAYLSKANDESTIALWQDAFAKGDGLARVRNTTAFDALGLDIKTGVAKVKAAEDTGGANTRATEKPATTAPANVTPANLKEAVATVPTNDLASALAALPATTFAEVVATAARMSYSKGLDAVDVHFVDAIISAAKTRTEEKAIPATPCKAA